MLVFWKENLVFLAVPKTGTTAYHTALAPYATLIVNDPPELKHAPLYRYNRFFRPMFDKFGGVGLETLAVIREPINWLGSWYRYRQRPFMEGRQNSTHGITFDEFVEGYMMGKPPSFANVGSQAKFLEPRPNGTAVTHLFQYEEQAKLKSFIENRLGQSLVLDQENVSPQIDLQLSKPVETRLRRKYRAEFELWESAKR